MPCIFCIAVIAMIAGAMAAGAVDQVEDGLADKAAGTLRRAADTDTVTKWDLTVKVGSRSVPLAVTLFKDHGRVRVQKLLREICEAIGAKMVSQSSPDDQAHTEADHDAEPAVERQSPPPERRSEAAPDSEPPERQRRR
jgi:Ni/Co efflux regulator RcnB